MVKEQEGVNKITFFSKIDTHLADANVTDARELAYNSDIKTEYTSEFSLDKIAAVVTSALNALEKSYAPTVKVPALTKDAIDAYTDVVNSVAEAAKSSSTSSASLSFSMNRLSPGVFAFLYATSVNIKDADTFGTEAVTTTAIYYRLMQSIDDVKNDAVWGQAIIDAKNLMAMKTLQAALTDDLAAGKINLDEWAKKDAEFSKMVDRLVDRLEAHKFNMAKPVMLTRATGFGAPVRHSFAEGSVVTQEVVRAAIRRLSLMGEGNKVVIERSEARLASGYY